MTGCQLPRLPGLARLFTLVLATGLAGALGCGSGLGQVSGTVSQGGRPLADAWVEFHPASGGRPGVGRTDGSGGYTLEYPSSIGGAAPGSYKVKIGTGGVDMPDGRSSTPTVELYSTTADVTGGSQTLDFTVPDSPPAKKK